MATHSLPKRFYLPPLSRGQPLADRVGVMSVEWRQVEQALIEIATNQGIRCDENTKSGDKWICTCDDINATELAKELAERLK